MICSKSQQINDINKLYLYLYFVGAGFMSARISRGNHKGCPYKCDFFVFY